MQRREFLIRAGMLVMAVPLGKALAACGDGGGTGKTAYRFTSSETVGHNHALDLEFTLLESPPSGGVDDETSASTGHTHRVTLTAQEVATLRDGGTVEAETSLVNDHRHDFTLRLANSSRV